MARRRRVVILTAIRMEAVAVCKAIDVPPPAPHHPARASIQGVDLSVNLIGIGAIEFPDTQSDEPPDVVIMAGLAGALDPSLVTGDVVIDGLPAASCTELGGRPGRIYTSRNIVGTPREKAELFVSTRALAVDMETDPARAWALRHNAAFVAIRAISDRADQTIDPSLLSLVDCWGRPRPAAIALAVLRSPRRIGELSRLAADTRIACERLGSSVRKLLLSLTVILP